MLNKIKNTILLLLLINIFSFNYIFAQNLQNLGLDNKDQVMRLPEGFVIESEIDSDKYILGPGDKIGLSVITSAKMAYVLTINPTGELWVPDLGSIHVSGLSINVAERKVAEYIKNNRFKSAEVALILLNIRYFKIQVTGAVINQGFHTISSISRLSDIILKAGGMHKFADETSIVINNKYGDAKYFNLKEFLFNGNLANNPILKEGDVVNVSFNNQMNSDIEAIVSNKNSLVYITGFVLRPTGHKYIPGYTVNDYISMSGGVTDHGDRKKLAVFRNGEKIFLENKYALQPGDEINVSANIKYRLLGNMSALQTLTSMMTLYLTYQAATN